MKILKKSLNQLQNNRKRHLTKLFPNLLHFKKQWDQAEEGQALPQPELVAIDAPQIELDETSLAGEYLEKYSQRKGDADRASGISRNEGKYFVGGKRVIIDNDSNLFVDGKRYEATQVFGVLLFRKSQKLMKFHKKIKINTRIFFRQQMRSLILINMVQKR